MSKSQFPMMGTFPETNIADEADLTMEQVGCYRTLLDAIWHNNGQPLADDDQSLARRFKMSVAQWKKNKNVICRFFDLSEGYWRHIELEKNWKYTERIATRNRINGMAGGRPKKPSGFPVGMPKTNPNESESKAHMSMSMSSGIGVTISKEEVNGTSVNGTKYNWNDTDFDEVAF